jgi:hypothetical protein
MADPVVTPTAIALATLAAIANLSDLVQGADAYLSLADPAAGCALDVEPFSLMKPPPKDATPVEDRNKALRAEGAKPSSRADKPKGAPTPPYQPSRTSVKALLTVRNKKSRLDGVLGILSDEPRAALLLDIWDLESAVVCIPWLGDRVGFDSRIGNQVSFKCRATPAGDSAATILTEAHYNPFNETAGFITAIHHVTMTDRVTFRLLKILCVPSDAFTVTREDINPTVMPKAN